jgi:hypothetical protein
VLSRLSRHAVELTVLLFAALGFVLVPLGRKTGLEHLVSVLSTSAAAEAGRELLEAGDKVRQRVTDALMGRESEDTRQPQTKRH